MKKTKDTEAFLGGLTLQEADDVIAAMIKFTEILVDKTKTAKQRETSTIKHIKKMAKDFTPHQLAYVAWHATMLSFKLFAIRS